MKCYYCGSEDVDYEETYIKRGTIEVKHAITVQCNDCMASYDYNTIKHNIINIYNDRIYHDQLNPETDLLFYNIFQNNFI